MKVAHINIFLSGSICGVEKKLKEQALLAAKAGLDMDFILLNSGTNGTYGNLHLVSPAPFFHPAIDRIARKLFRYYLLAKTVDLNKYDLIVLRYANSDFSSFFFALKYGKKIFSEHHTNEIMEISASGGVKNKIKAFVESILSLFYLNFVRGFVAVTGEIAALQERKILRAKPFFVFSNGIDENAFSFVKRQKRVIDLRIIFVASNFTHWHGLDRILAGAKAYRGAKKISLKIVGKVTASQEQHISSIKNPLVDITVCGLLGREKLDLEFSSCDLAISSLAVFRNKIQQACALKTREYIARGIPFVYAYDDVDLNAQESFALKLEANETQIDLERIVEFYDALDLEQAQKDMQKMAKERLSWSVKLAGLYEFLRLNGDGK